MSAEKETGGGECLAARLFDGMDDDGDVPEPLMDELRGVLRTAGVPFERIGWDYYDNSVELYEVPPDYRMPEAAQRAVYDAGFATAYVNHSDKWETHYNWKVREPFKPSDGWRVSYPHKREVCGASGILVEKQPASWPQEWFDTGYAVVKHPADE